MSSVFDQQIETPGSVVIEWDSGLSPFEALSRLRHLQHCLLMESAMIDNEVGRYSFLVADPIKTFRIEHHQEIRTGENPFAELENELKSFQFETIPGLPPFQGGAAGLLSYELNQSFEKIENEKPLLTPTPKMLIGVYDVVLAWDHFSNQCWLISRGFPESDLVVRQKLAEQRARQFLEWLQTPCRPKASADSSESKDGTCNGRKLPVDQFSVPKLPQITSNFDENGYLKSVERVINYIFEGDIFQANFAQSLLTPAQGESLELYSRLRRRNPAPFAAYFDTGDVQILSASPERFFSIRNRNVQTRPIKGTRRRTCYPEADLPTSLQLQTSEKDRAENIMIVDLLRNDLSRVCEDDSVLVKKLCQVESYRSVLHLVSVIEARLRNEKTAFDLLKATFPGGSITGAPKVRAMEIIAELEPTRRGAYCGSVGYIGFDGNADFNILIRTISASRELWQIPVGGGIVADSNPNREYEETWTKAAGMLGAIRSLRDQPLDHTASAHSELDS